MNSLQKISNLATRASPRSNHFLFKSLLSTKPTKSDDEWNDAWEAAWLPDDLNGKSRAPWETDVNFPSSPVAAPDPETKAFVEDMNEKWQERRNAKLNPTAKPQTGIDEKNRSNLGEGGGSSSLYSLENIKKDYRVKKQRVHAGLWAKEIERMQEEEKGEAKFGESDIDRLLDSCSEIFDTANDDLDFSKIPSSSEFKNKPDGWETTSKAQDGNIWEMSQREEDILLQEFDRRIAYSKFQIASFIKSHIFSRRRPIDGWKYMIEVVGPNARKGKGSVARIPALSDAATQPFQEEKIPIDSSAKPLRGR